MPQILDWPVDGNGTPVEETSIERAVVVCLMDPRGAHGLKGFGEGRRYRAELMRGQDGQALYWRIYPREESGFHEFVTLTAFALYFARAARATA